MKCDDGGTCHHSCAAGECFRRKHAGPFGFDTWAALDAAGKPALTPEQRWEQGVDHDPRSEKIVLAMAKIDFEVNNDELCIKTGGDGDNGETMMYLLDCHFAQENADDD